jgi:hypothetical protein
VIWVARLALGSLVLFWIGALVRAIKARLDERYRVTTDTPGPGEQATVGVVVPARNEAGNIGPCVDAILAQDHPVRLVVIDDGSTDGTTEVLSARSDDSRLTVLQGGDGALPEGWLGKAWACERAGRSLLEQVPPQTGFSLSTRMCDSIPTRSRGLSATPSATSWTCCRGWATW